jgi:hypothetical protein
VLLVLEITHVAVVGASEYGRRSVLLSLLPFTCWCTALEIKECVSFLCRTFLEINNHFLYDSHAPLQLMSWFAQLATDVSWCFLSKLRKSSLLCWMSPHSRMTCSNLERDVRSRSSLLLWKDLFRCSLLWRETSVVMQIIILASA